MKGSLPLPLNVFAGTIVSCNISRVPIDLSVSRFLSSIPVTVATTAASCSASGASLKFSFSKSASTEAVARSAVEFCVLRTPSACSPPLCVRGQADRSVRFLHVKHAGESSTEVVVKSVVDVCALRAPSATSTPLCVRGQPDRSVRFLHGKLAGNFELVWSGTGHVDSLFSSGASSRDRQVFSKTDLSTLILLVGDSSSSPVLRISCASRRSWSTADALSL